MPLEGYGLKLWWNWAIVLWTARTKGKGHIRKEESIELCSLSSQVFMHYVCPHSQSARLLKHLSLPQREQVGWVDDIVILTAWIRLICLSGLRNTSDMFPPCLLFREKVVSDQYLGKHNIRIYCVIYDRVKFHTVLQVTWNVFALACPLTALNWITGISSGIYSGRSCSLNHLLPLGRRAGRMLLLWSVLLGCSDTRQVARVVDEWELHCSPLAELAANYPVLLRGPMGVALDLFLLQDCYILVCGMGGVGGNFLRQMYSVQSDLYGNVCSVLWHLVG